MKAFRIALATLALLVPSAARAQHYRVLVGLAGTHDMLLLDFSPCIPAEGSGCGGFLTRTIDTSADSTFGGVPAAATKDSSDGSRIAIVNGAIDLMTRSSRDGVPARRVILDHGRIPVAVVTAGSRYAFAVLASKRDDLKAQVRMFDLETRTAVASLLIDGIPTGLSIAR